VNLQSIDRILKAWAFHNCWTPILLWSWLLLILKILNWQLCWYWRNNKANSKTNWLKNILSLWNGQNFTSSLRITIHNTTKVKNFSIRNSHMISNLTDPKSQKLNYNNFGNLISFHIITKHHTFQVWKKKLGSVLSIIISSIYSIYQVPSKLHFSKRNLI